MDCCGYANLVDFTQSRFIPVYRRQNLYAETAVFVSSPARRLQTRNFFLSAYHSTGSRFPAQLSAKSVFVRTAQSIKGIRDLARPIRLSQAIKTQIHRNSNSRSRHTRPLFHLLVMPVAVSSDPDHWIAHVRLFSCRNVQISLYTTRHLVPLPSRSPIRILLSSTPLFHALPGLFSLTSTFPRSDNANTSPNDK